MSELWHGISTMQSEASATLVPVSTMQSKQPEPISVESTVETELALIKNLTANAKK